MNDCGAGFRGLANHACHASSLPGRMGVRLLKIRNRSALAECGGRFLDASNQLL
jgi:hypothetical protein